MDLRDVDIEAVLSDNLDLLLRCLVVSSKLLLRLGFIEFFKDKLSIVDSQRTPDAKTESLLRVISSLATHQHQQQQQIVFNKFLLALRQDGQEHVANVFHPASDLRPMSDEHYELLRIKQKQICEYLDPLNGLIDELVKCEVFTAGDQCLVISETGYDNMSRKVIDILLHKPDSAFDGLIYALIITSQEHVASLLGHETECIPLTEERRKLLIDKKAEVIKIMEADCGLLDELVTKGILTVSDQERVREMKKNEEMSTRIVEFLFRKSNSDFHKFIDALCNTKQEHVASLMGHNTDSIPMTPEHRELLNRNMNQLCDFINPTNYLLQELFSLVVFSSRDMESVRSKLTCDEMSLELVNILLRKPDSSFDKFIEALNNTEQQHVVYILTGQGESPLSRVRRLVLRKARDRLVSRVDTLHSSLLNKLISSGVLTDDNKQRIVAHKVNEDRTAELIDIIARKSQQVYDRFLQALMDSGHSKVAVLLRGLEMTARVDVNFLSGTSKSERRRIIQIVFNNMKALVSGTEGDIGAISSLMEQNGFAVRDVYEGSIHISFRCFTEESLVNLKRLYTDKTLDKLFTQVFCSEFAQQGLESLTLNITDDAFNKCAVMLRFISSQKYMEAMRGEEDQILKKSKTLQNACKLQTWSRAPNNCSNTRSTHEKEARREERNSYQYRCN